MKVQNLRKKYPQFVYEKYSYRISKNNLEIFFDFKVPPDIKFEPKLVIKNVSHKIIKQVEDKVLNNLIFHLGLIEIPSYWKATCSPKILIKAGPLNKEQIKWWKDLIINGMGQFFYENKIDWRSKSFLAIKSPLEARPLSVFDKKLRNRYLVPFAGG